MSNNKALRSALEDLGRRYRMPCLIAEPRHTGDNAAMIAFAAYADPQGVTVPSSEQALTIQPALRLG